jgi:hypothetical protein
VSIEKYQALKSFDHLKWGRDRIVLLGDHQDAERCKKLERRRIALYAPSQWRQRFPDGYIQFGIGRGRGGCGLFDLRHQTINGTPTYIFEYSEGIDLLSRRLKALSQLSEYSKIHQGDDLVTYAELVVRTVNPTIPLWRNEDWLRRKICAYLPVVGLPDLEALVEAAKPSVITYAVLMQKRAV